MKPTLFLLVLLGLIALRATTLAWLPVIDPSEARYAMVGKDMASSGDWVTPMIWERGEHIPFFSKPPLLFWLQAMFMQPYGMTALAARLPSFVAALAILFTGWIFLRRILPGSVLQGSLLILFSSPLFFFVAGLALTDMLLCLTVIGALFSHYAFTREEDPRRARRMSLAAFAFLGLGMLAKGPVAIALFGLPVFAFTLWRRRWRDFSQQAWGPGLLLFLLIWAPWYLLSERANPGFLEYFFLNENLLRFTANDFGDRYGAGHLYPRGMALLFFILAVLPWAVLLGWQLRGREARRLVLARLREEDLQFFLFALGGILLFLSLSRHLLGTYVLPALPAAAVIGAALLLALGFGIERQARIAAGLVVLYTLAILIALPIARGRRSSEEVVQLATAFQAARGADGRLVFVDQRPFSARFYAGNKADYIPWDAGNEHYRWYLEPENGHLLILQPHHPDVLDAYVTDRLRRVAESGTYSVWEPVPPVPPGQS